MYVFGFLVQTPRSGSGGPYSTLIFDMLTHGIVRRLNITQKWPHPKPRGILINESCSCGCCCYFLEGCFHCVDQEVKIKLREGYRLTQDHTANRWTNWNSLSCFLTPSLASSPAITANTTRSILGNTALLIKFPAEQIPRAPHCTRNKISIRVLGIQSLLPFSHGSFLPTLPLHTLPYPPFKNPPG